MRNTPGLRIAIVGTGISGLSAAWLLNQHHAVTIFEQDDRIGGHAHTIDVDRAVPVDTGFIVYNPPNYPNFTALLAHLGVPSIDTDMSFAVSLRNGAFEYAGSNLGALFVQPFNALRPSFWSMLRDLHRFYTTATTDVAQQCAQQSLGEYLSVQRYGRAFLDLHLLPMAAAIWSAPAQTMLDYPAAAFIRFFANHGLLNLTERPPWRTVAGGSRAYVTRLSEPLRAHIRTATPVKRIVRHATGVTLQDSLGAAHQFDHVVVATHADQALALLGDADSDERRLLGAFRYSRNEAVLHTDTAMMPRRRRGWSSWNYIGGEAPGAGLCVTYWMNQLQKLDTTRNYFVTLNPTSRLDATQVLHREIYEHPVFDTATDAAQRALWSLQGRRNTWFCGAYFGAGFHEDGLQAGLAVAEDLGGAPRPWRVAHDSQRIVRGPRPHVCEQEHVA